MASHVAPTINGAAAAAGRTAPRIVASLPVAVTDDVEGTKEMVNKVLRIYGTLPSYRAMLDREGAALPADVGLIGSREQVLDGLHALSEAGATEFSAAVTALELDRDATYDALTSYS